MNNLNQGVSFYPHLFMLEKIDTNLVRFNSKLIYIRCVDDLKIYRDMLLKCHYNNNHVCSSVLSNNNSKIFNLLLEELSKKPNVKQETILFNLLKENFGVLELY